MATNKPNWNLIMACLAMLTLSGAGVTGYTVVKEDIKENQTKIEQQEAQNTERYENIQKQLGTILDHILDDDDN